MQSAKQLTEVLRYHEYLFIYLLTYLTIGVLWMLQKSSDDQRYRGGGNVAQSQHRLPLLGSFHTTEAYVLFTLSHGQVYTRLGPVR